MLERIRELFTPEEILAGGFGLERETLRTTNQGKLATTMHPAIFGSKLRNPYITTDFSESQIEVITPIFNSTSEAYHFVNALYDIVALNIEEEYLWPQSMPCDIPEDEAIPIAEYEDCEPCKTARIYREKLFKKYGGKKQLISGIHFNFSFEEEFIKKLHENMGKNQPYKLFKDEVYLKVVRNYLEYRWLMVYLIAATPVMHDSYMQAHMEQLKKIGEGAYSSEGAMSYRLGTSGYKNTLDLYPDYTSVATYTNSLNEFVADGHLQNYKELYSQIRPKAKDNGNLLESINQDGIQYIEVRSVDENPFAKGGITLEQLDFMHLFMIYLLYKEENTTISHEERQKEGNYNQQMIAESGLLDIKLLHNGQEVDKVTWGLEILEEMLEMNNSLGLGKAELINQAIERVKDVKLTIAYRLKVLITEKGYIASQLELAKAYAQDAYNHRYKLEGYEELELSTQILMRDAITRGIKVDVLDRFDNFIELKDGAHVEYVKQATKTSKDSYITMLMMENKTVTKKVLERNGVNVPKGIEVTKGQSLQLAARRYAGRPAVVKPKSTNFGTGISIFTEGGSEEDLVRALEIGLEYDDTVLVEEFAKGKEYRFLVIGDEVAGILHRVPANVKGDGKSSIRELVEVKNQDSLRGKGYKTPLEKIKLDASSELFLKQKDLNFDYVPVEGEVVYLRENSNISTGGDSIDYTDAIPNRFKKIAVEAAKAMEAKFCGVDMMIEDYSDENSNYAIIELNFNPAIHIHCYPYQGTERRIGEKVLKVLGFESVGCK
ncbi:bifunctional glutamate--cysteine ligase GshA/glutathione synthetase GshB [Cellulosilyticum ruminicola]|uniref:bifunctional glutamate--cysteine ligase GshA/glutathione synthetase GshB n=1 Tax=Cellulosilyticum ruminicola TaxID=425254 RepID=UPI0006D0F05D|nr:bifunctional glutamate--cysteine ligase GshA/glutathione synthetase GshB [Cellulosilyticum ruminicola]